MKLRTLLATIAVVLVAASAVRTQDQPAGDALSRGFGVAVIPFSNVTGQAADTWIGTGIAETVLADLQRGGALSVIGLERIQQEAQSQGLDLTAENSGDAIALGQDLGAAWLVTGSFQRLGQQVRIMARVVDVGTGSVSRTAKLDGTVDELFTLQDQIVAALGLDLGARPPTPPSRVSAAQTAVRVPDVPSGFDLPFPAAPAAGAADGLTPSAGEETPPVSVPPPVEVVPAPENLDLPFPRAGRVTGPDGADAADGLEARAPQVESPQEGLIFQGRDDAEATPTAGGPIVPAAVPGRRPTVTVARTSQPPRLDGRLDDRIWREAVRITEFTQRQPIEGAPATEQTEVYVAYDNQRIYFGIYAHYSDMNLIRANRADRDQTGRDDIVSVWFDPFLDQQRAYIFSVNGYGIQADSLMSGGGGGNGGGGGGGGRGNFQNGGTPGDSSWDALYDSAGTLVSDGWTAEMAIPFKSLRYPSRESGEAHRWGFQIERKIESKNETVVWSPESRSVMGRLRQMGVLDGLADLSTSRNLEFLPTVSAIQVGNLDTTTGALVNDDVEEGGLGIKYGLTSNLTLDFTYNPDFSQIESDQPQIEVNQRFPLFFSELRPFFIEGQEIFDIGGPATLLHTRTIVDPQFGAKLTGKVGRTTVGVLVANDEAPGNVEDRTDPLFGQNAQAIIGRVRYDLYSESHLGAIITDRELMDSYSRLAGIDGRFALGQSHRVEFQTMLTDRSGLDGVQQRGSLYDVQFRKQGRNLQYRIETFGIDPDFRNDLGFVERTDTRQTQGQLEYRWWPEGTILNWGPEVGYSRNYNYDGVLEDEQLQAGMRVQFSSNIMVNLTLRRALERFGGINFWKTNGSLFGQVNTSRRFSIGGGFQPGDQIAYDFINPSASYLGKGFVYRVFANLRPITRLSSQININGSSLKHPTTDDKIFDVKIVRALTTYQFTPRLLFRNISEYNTFDRSVALNFLATYRVNAGTAFYIGYDDHYQQESRIDPLLFTTDAWRRTNRAIFAKLQYLFRY